MSRWPSPTALASREGAEGGPYRIVPVPELTNALERVETLQALQPAVLAMMPSIQHVRVTPTDLATRIAAAPGAPVDEGRVTRYNYNADAYNNAAQHSSILKVVFLHKVRSPLDGV